MAYTFQPLEAALDSLGVNYTDGVTVRISEKYTVNCDLVGVESLLHETDPKVQSLHAEYDTGFEKQVLQDLNKYREEKEKKDEERKQRIIKYETRRAEEKERKRKEEEEKALEDERKHLEEIEREKEACLAEEKKRKEKEEEEEKQKKKEEEEKLRHEEEVEWKRFEEERARSESISRKQTSLNGVEPNLTSEPSDHHSTIPEPEPSSDINFSLAKPKPIQTKSEPTENQDQPEPTFTQPKPNQPVIIKPNKPVAINFSDFEAEADVFADMELRTINDFAELQTILGAGGNIGVSGHHGANHGANPTVQAVNGFYGNSPVIGSVPSYPNQTGQPSLYQGNDTFSQQSSQGFPANPFSNMSSFPQRNGLSNRTGAEGTRGTSFQSPTSQLSFQGTPISQQAFPRPQTSQPSFPGSQISQQTFSGPPTSQQSFSGVQVSQQSFSGGQPSFSGSQYTWAGSQGTQYPNMYPYPGYTGYQPSDKFFPAVFPPGVSNPGETNSRQSKPQHPGLDKARSDGSQHPSRSKSSDRSVTRLNSEGPKDDDAKVGTGELKPSRSVGDLISELQKEAVLIAEHKRKLVQTPPPRPVSRGQSGLEDWVPWPKIGVEDPLDGLGEKEKEICSQIAEMGFPISRLAAAARCFGADSQKLLNFCILVDRLVEDGWSEEVSLEVTQLHAADENLTRKHLGEYKKLLELGFIRQDVHRALIDTGIDHQKALEQLIK